MSKKFYLGDGAYAEPSGHGFWITAENGIEVTASIHLEPQHIARLYKEQFGGVDEK